MVLAVGLFSATASLAIVSLIGFLAYELPTLPFDLATTRAPIELSVSLADAVKLNYSELLREEMLRLGMPIESVLRAEFD